MSPKLHPRLSWFWCWTGGERIPTSASSFSSSIWALFEYRTTFVVYESRRFHFSRHFSYHCSFTVLFCRQSCHGSMFFNQQNEHKSKPIDLCSFSISKMNSTQNFTLYGHSVPPETAPSSRYASGAFIIHKRQFLQKAGFKSSYFIVCLEKTCLAWFLRFYDFF